ncbi:hypothetical protein [Peribacillus loiseleuriae]|uniref:hypothetical protein n=1 Tax=Peribacillus loiseleuriae TaxID=1679170 RepID=UPI003CFFF4A7
MDKNYLATYIRVLKRESENSENLIPAEECQQILIDELNKLQNEYFGKEDSFLYHHTSLENSIGIIKEELVEPRAYSAEQLQDMSYMPLYINTGGHAENVVMNSKLVQLMVLLDELKIKANQDSKLINEVKKRAVILNEISKDTLPKIFLHDEPDYAFKVLPPKLSMFKYDYSMSGATALLCFNKSKVDHVKKLHYKEDANNRISEMFYCVNEDEEEYINDFIKENANLLKYEVVSYDELPLHHLEYLVLFDKFKIKDVFKYDGKGDFDLIRQD